MARLLFILSAFLLALPADNPAQEGEILRFSVSYNWHAAATDVASATISFTEESLDGQPVQHVSLNARTAKFFDVFFKVREALDSWVSETRHLPVKYIRNTREGSYTAFNQYAFDWQAGIIHAIIQKRDQAAESVDIPVDGPCYDLPSLMYYIRHLDLTGVSVGKTFRVPYVFSTEKSAISLIYKGNDVRSIRGLGKVSVLRFSLTVADENVFDKDSLAEIWFSDDENRIPVYFVAPLKVGAMSGRLKTYSGLKKPFTALQR